MKRVFFSFLSILALSGAALEQRLSFEAEVLNGCYVDGGKFRLHHELPSQEKAENLLIACAKPVRIFFQEDVFARKAGAKSEELVQIKKSSSEYTPQHDDPEAGCGYIDYTKFASYQYQIRTAGRYTVWFRVWTPSVANWQFSVFDDRGGKHEIDLKDSIPSARTWFWKKGFVIELNEGNHQIQIVQAMFGKRISGILLSRDPDFVPSGDIPASSYRKIRQGTVLFKKVFPPGLEQWSKFSAEVTGHCRFLVSGDNGKTFQELENDNLKKFGRKPLLLKLIMSRDKQTEPAAEHVQASYQYDEKLFVQIRAGKSCYSFSRKDGALTNIVNLSTGTVVKNGGGSMFSLLLKTRGKNDKRYLDMKDACLNRLRQRSENALECEWNFPKESIAVRFRITARESSLVWRINVENKHPESDVIEVEGPLISGLRISENPAHDMLVWPFSAGEFIPFPAEKGEFSITYPDHAGLPFAILTNGKESFYYACHDAKLLITEFTSAANAASDSISLRICRKHRIPAGSSREDTFVTALLDGSWHNGADLYRSYFYSHYPKNSYRPWLRNSDGWLQGASCGHSGLMKQYKDYTAFQLSFKSAAFLSLDYVQMWGSTFNGACPAYYLPRLDKGGEKMFAEQMKFWRDNGGYTGHYYFANGISPYYLLTDRYFGVPWSKYPKEYRPPSFKWYVQNREYISDSAAVDEAALRKQTARINEVHRKRQIVKGNYEETTGYMPMNWRNGEYAKFLYKWIDIYVSRYHCNTAYLDTFAFRNDLPDFNPYLKCNGEGDKPMFKRAFLEKLIRDMREKEPEFCALTEGIADVFGTHLYFLLSGFARNPNIFRYTLPDQIIFQGSCNGLWSKPLTKQSILQAFLCGNRYDLVLIYPETYYMLKLRQQISPFLNLAVFDDVKGIHVSDPDIVAFAHKILPETASLISGGEGTRAVTLTIGNPDGKSGRLDYELPKGFRLKRAMLCELYKDPAPLAFSRKGDRITFQVPAAAASAVILIDTIGGPHRFTVTAEQTSENTVSVKTYNFMEEDTAFTVSAGEQKKNQRIRSGDSGSVEFTFARQPGDFRILQVTVSAPGMKSVKRMISTGRTAQKIPLPELPAQKSGKDLKLDFEETVYSEKAAFSGKRGMLLKGNGKFCMHKIPLALVPEAHYEMTAQIRKSEDVSPKSGDCFGMVAFYTAKEKKLERLVFLGGNVVNDNRFHSVKVEFHTPGNLHEPALYLYNNNSQGCFSVDDVNIVEISRARSVQPEKTASAGAATWRKVMFHPGETELDESFPSQDKHVIRLKGNGKYLQRKIPLNLKAGKTYRLSFLIRKGFDVSKVGHENMVGVFNYTREGKLECFLRLAYSVKPDNRFHRCEGSFTVPETVHDCALYIYNRNTEDVVTVGKISLMEKSG